MALVVVLAIGMGAGAATLTVSTTDLSNVTKDTFVVGETFLLQVTGDTQGPAPNENSIFGRLFWDGALTTTVIDPPGCNGSPNAPCTTLIQGVWTTDVGSMDPADGSVTAFNQTGPGVQNQVATSIITLRADAIGSTAVTWGGLLLDFAGIYAYDTGGISVPTGHSFTIVPEPAAPALIAAGLLGLVAWRGLRSGS